MFTSWIFQQKPRRVIQTLEPMTMMMMRILAIGEIVLTATWFVVSAGFAVVFAVLQSTKNGKIIADQSHSTDLPLICVGSAVLAAMALILMIRKRTNRSTKRF